jgi:hypothetical protein
MPGNYALSDRGTKATDPAASSRTSRKPVRPKRVLTGDDWDEIVRIIGPDLQQDFMIDTWKLINRYERKLWSATGTGWRVFPFCADSLRLNNQSPPVPTGGFRIYVISSRDAK